MENKLVILILTIISICIVYYYLYHYKSKGILNNRIKNKLSNDMNDIKLYYQHHESKINKITKSVLNDLNFKHTYKLKHDWLLYIPKNYNYVELELVDIKPHNQHQLIYAIKGCDSLCSKNQLWFNLKTKYGRDIAKTLIPETFNLNDTDDINIFKTLYILNKNTNINTNNNNNNNNTNVFILKKNIQGKKGLLLVNNSVKALREGKLNNFKIIQKYIPNPFTINNRKLNLRLYVVIICYQGKQEWLLFKEGKCIYTNKRYDKDNSLRDDYIADKEQHFTSLNLDIDKVYLDEALPESLEELQTYLGNSKYNFVMDNILNILQKIKTVYLTKLGKLNTLKQNKCFQLFGIDFLMDEHLKPYLLEFNKGPSMGIKSPKDKELKTNVITSIFNYCLFNNYQKDKLITIT